MLLNLAVSGGWLTWDHYLSSAFAVDFEKLMARSITLGSVVGSAVRIVSGFVHANSDEVDLVYSML